MDKNIRRYLTTALGIGATLLALPILHAGQASPPINGVTGTIALEGTVDQTQKAANTVVVKTLDGVKHLFHLTGKTVVHGGEAFNGLAIGSTVVVHYLAEGGEQTALEVDRVDDADKSGLKTTEGVVTRIDRAGRTISIRLANGSTETLRLTDRAATDAGKDVDRAADGTTKVVVYYADEAGERVAHYFKRVS